MGRSQLFVAVDILSNDEHDAPYALSLPHHRAKKKSLENSSGRGGESAPTFMVVDDDPTLNPVCTPSVVSFGSDASIVKCSLARANSKEKFTGISGLICLDSDNESEGGSSKGILKVSGNMVEWLGRETCISRSPSLENPILDTTSANEHDGLFYQMKDVTCEGDLEGVTIANLDSCDGYAGISASIKISGYKLPHDDYLAKDFVARARHDNMMMVRVT